MNVSYELAEIARLIEKAHDRLQSVIETQPKPTLGKPPAPSYGQRVARKIWNVWDELKAKGEFDAAEAKRIATGDTDQRHYRIDSSYSAILSKWAQEGYLDRAEEGSGPRPAIYKIPK
jgi:hypothetical protein